MKARERGVDNVRSLPANVQQHQAAVGEEPVHPKGVLGAVPPGAVRELVEIRVGRHEEELLVVIGGILFVSFDDLLTGSSSLLAARGRIAPGGQCGRRLAVEMGWHSEKGVLVFCGCLVCLPASLFSRYLRYVTLIPFLLVVFGMFGYLKALFEPRN